MARVKLGAMVMKGISAFPKLRHYWDLTIRLFSVISGHSWRVGSYPSPEKHLAYSTAPANWTKYNNDENNMKTHDSEFHITDPPMYKFSTHTRAHAHTHTHIHNGKKVVLCITGASPSDFLVSYPRHSLVCVAGLPFCRDAVGIFYSPSWLGHIH